MNAIGERSVALWMTVEAPTAPSLDADASADVAIVGAGIAGLSTAYEVALLGRSVIVLDAGAIAGGMTSRTTAHLNSSLDDYYHRLIDIRGQEAARLHHEARAAAIDRIENVQDSEGIDCDFRRLDSYLFAGKSADEETLSKEFEACRKIGFDGVEVVEDTPIRGAGVGRALRFPRQARFHPRKYVNGLVAAIRRRGGKLYADTRVTAVEEKDGAVAIATAGGATVRAGAAVVATNSPINDWVDVHTKQAPYRTYAIAGRAPRGAVPDALYWDTLDPYH
jgi:glycine/D-amino acid oxidase-like deaminating enzyme